MRYLGLDLGTKTVGLAISDRTGTIASTYGLLKFSGNYDELLGPLSKIAKEEQIDQIILGLPKNMNNTIGPRALETIEFQKKISEYLNMEVYMQDERLSTKEATTYLIDGNMSRKKRKGKVDSLAANIILQTYLDRMKG